MSSMQMDRWERKGRKGRDHSARKGVVLGRSRADFKTSHEAHHMGH